MFLELERDKKTHLIRYKRTLMRALKTSENYVEVVKKAIVDKAVPANGLRALKIESPDGELSVEAPQGRTAFVVWLGGLSFASFGPGAAPVSSLSEMLPPGIEAISDVHLYFETKGGAIEATDSSTNWTRPESKVVGHAKWASFVCDANIICNHSMIKKVQASISSDKIGIPLYYNLYVGDFPNWMLANMHDEHHPHPHDHDHNNDDHANPPRPMRTGRIDSHGGVHPTSHERAMMNDYYAGKKFNSNADRTKALKLLLSHGGVHPSLPKNNIAINLDP
ncbi:MAG: hypothetical protein ACSHX3_08755 [Litorimonas sp.]